MSTPSELLTVPGSTTQDCMSIARQAIVNQQGQVVGYELFDRTPYLNPHTPATDAAFLFNVVSHWGSAVMPERKALFINCTHATLAGGHLDLIVPELVVLEIPSLPQGQAQDIESVGQTLAEMRQRGFRLAFNYVVLSGQYERWLPLASFIKLDVTQLTPGAIKSLTALAQPHAHVRVIAEKVETQEQHDTAEAAGITLFQGYWFAKPTLLRGQTVRPAQAAVIQLMNLVHKQAETVEIETLLKREPKMSFNLLRFINSSGFGLNKPVTSFRHAVMILGLKKLFRWAALLMTTSPDGGNSAAVTNMAVVRGRLMEQLAAYHLDAEACDDAFVVGIFSMLDTMTGIPLDTALASIAMPDAVVEALLLKTGLLAPYLDMALACESSDPRLLDRANQTLQLSHPEINQAHLEALVWAESLDA